MGTSRGTLKAGHVRVNKSGNKASSLRFRVRALSDATASGRWILSFSDIVGVFFLHSCRDGDMQLTNPLLNELLNLAMKSIAIGRMQQCKPASNHGRYLGCLWRILVPWTERFESGHGVLRNQGITHVVELSI
jgi:hypothetical protein